MRTDPTFCIVGRTKLGGADRRGRPVQRPRRSATAGRSACAKVTSKSAPVSRTHVTDRASIPVAASGSISVAQCSHRDHGMPGAKPGSRVRVLSAFKANPDHVRSTGVRSDAYADQTMPTGTGAISRTVASMGVAVPRQLLRTRCVTTAYALRHGIVATFAYATRHDITTKAYGAVVTLRQKRTVRWAATADPAHIPLTRCYRPASVGRRYVVRRHGRFRRPSHVRRGNSSAAQSRTGRETVGHPVRSRGPWTVDVRTRFVT